MEKSNAITVTVVGGGNSAHILIPFLSTAGHKVNLLTRRPNDWDDTITCEETDMNNNVTKTFRGNLAKKSENPEDVIPDADAIILCMPVHTQREVLSRIGPHIDQSKPDVFVGTIYGQAGFNWMVHEIEKEHQLSNIVCFAIGLIPWICRTISYGSKAANYGGKQVNIVAVTPSVKFAKLNELLLDDICYNPLGTGKFLLACSFLSLTLSVDNQIIHPGRCYGLFRKCGGRWPSLDSVPYFYRDFDDVSAEHIKRLDDDYSVIRTAVRLYFPKRKFKYMLSYLDQLNLTHDSDVVDIKASFKDSEQLGLIKTPTVEQSKPDTETETEVGQKSTVRVLDTSCRFFTDDIPYGLLIGKWIAEQLEVATPFIDEVIRWAQNLRNEHWLDADGKIDMSYCLSHQSFSGIPPSYGITSVDAILD